MSTRTLSELTKYVIKKAHTEPNPDAREAYRDVLLQLCSMDRADVGELVALTAPIGRGLCSLPRDWSVLAPSRPMHMTPAEEREYELEQERA